MFVVLMYILALTTVWTSVSGIDECYSGPCQNNGTCNDLTNAYSCDCLPGFNGTNCEIDIDECESQPCENNGTCIDMVDDYLCDCLPGYYGTDCEMETGECVGQSCLQGRNETRSDTDDCYNQPCQNNGICNDLYNTYTCDCPPGYNGTDCEIDIDECYSQPCQNNGTCDDLINEYYCYCQPGYNGTDCEQDCKDVY